MSFEQNQHSILVSFDHEKDYFPQEFKRDNALVRLEELVCEINATFKIHCGKNDKIQDGCFYAQIFLREIRMADWPPAIHLCNFGNMVAIANEDTLIPGALDKLKDIFKRMDFQYISEAVARSPYDGVDQEIKTWWQRYFDYL